MTSPSRPSSHPLPMLTMAEPAVPPIESAESGTLLEHLAQALEHHAVPYCQWKGHWSAHRWASGHGDVDLLVDHDALAMFRTVVGQLGFKLAYPSGERQIPAVEHYFGHDPAVPRLLHLHVHYRLVLGDYWKPVYRLPIERAMLDGAVPGRPFRVPSPAFQFLIFVLRMMLRQVGRPLLSARTRWTTGIQVPLAALEAGSDPENLASILKQHLASLDLSFFQRCVRSLQGESGPIERALLPWQLHQRLRALVRIPSIRAVLAGAAEKMLSRLFGLRTGRQMRLAGGGSVVALTGGDGTGTSTCARELTAWLVRDFPTMRAHLGRPPRSLLTLAVEAAFKARSYIDRQLTRVSPADSSLELLRHVCTARDRYRLYLKVRRFAVNGGIAICERYPVGEDQEIVGPRIPKLLSRSPGRFASRLQAAEAFYYDRILVPDELCVMQVDRNLADLSKPEEPAESDGAPSQVIGELNRNATGAHLIDGTLPLHELLRRLKSVIWATL